ncbi:MAG: DMT family transporter [Oscillatoriaceae bacterium SKW80]|nr:DMT family transporter [Oscillatoriaceae bacterium SKYG93]MCX8119422.1 DMT family transporter [Oscillatoriaceae bacterium SKW80]MDW8454889.1 DMT family transporter [Oscillatoriaceae cyanobacterium SKYGB_i_bin93]HIK28332.1 DMT family transporter [Oscillatoriaceae cyanobacterium M7585_C2015_266]
MEIRRANFSNWALQIPGPVYLFLGIVIFGMSTAFVRRLTEMGAEHISYLNISLAGNFCALIFMIAVYCRQWDISFFKQRGRREWLCLAAVGLLNGAIAPLLVFKALSMTPVANVVLVGRLEPLLVLVLSVWLLKERVTICQIIGTAIAFTGVGLTTALQTESAGIFYHVGKGEILVVGAAIAFASATLIIKTQLSQIPSGMISVSRAVAGTTVSFCLIAAGYDNHHLSDAFSPYLWQLMFLGGPIIFGLGQICWFTGVKNSAAADISLAGCFTPLAGVVAAYLILGEIPNFAQLIGGSVILAGLFLSQIGIVQQTKPVSVPGIPVTPKLSLQV